MIPYRPLDKSKEEIRVLVLLPDDDGDEEGIPRLRCRLEHAPLSKASFAALSYVWGPQDRARRPLEVHYPFPDTESEADKKADPREAEVPTVSPWDVDECTPETRHTTIGPNLSLALAHIRKPDEEIRLWVDAVCINQDDAVEKSWQVGLMARIYARASATLIWLGPNHEDNMGVIQDVGWVLGESETIGRLPAAAECLSRFGTALMGMWLSTGRNWLPPSHPPTRRDPHEERDEEIARVIAFGYAVCHRLAQDSNLTRFYHSLQSLAHRAWFTRAWVLQEFILPTSVTWVLGKLQVNEDMLHIVVMLAKGFWEVCMMDDEEVNSVLRDHVLRGFISRWLRPVNTRLCVRLVQRAVFVTVGLHNLMSDLFLFNSRDKVEAADPGDEIFALHGLYNLMSHLYLSNSGDKVEATDPRDRIFALLGLVNDTMGLEPNYNLSVEHVYTITAAKFLLSGNAALLSVPRSSATNPKLPSWVMDWSAVPSNPGRWLQFNASRGAKPEAVYPPPCYLVRTDVKSQLNPAEVSVLGAWRASPVEDPDDPGLARRISLRGLRLDSVALLGLVAEDHLYTLPEDSDTITTEIENIKREVSTHWILDHDLKTDEESDAALECFSRYFCHLRSWLSNILDFAKDDKEKLSKVLDVILHKGNTQRDRDGLYSSFRGQITSTDDLMDPRKWLPDTFDRSKLVLGIRVLADGCRIFKSAEGRFGYVPAGAVPGDVIAILFGVSAPLVIRPGNNGCFTIIGPAYVSGVMNGEAVHEANPSEMFIFE